MVWYWGNLNNDAQGECMCPNSLEMFVFLPQSYIMTPVSIFTCILFMSIMVITNVKLLLSASF